MGCLEGNFEISLQILSPRICVGALSLLLLLLFLFQLRMTHSLYPYQSSPLHKGPQTHCSSLDPCWHDGIRYRFGYLPMGVAIYSFIPDEVLAKDQM